MNKSALDRTAREAGGRIIAALAARFREVDLAEEAFADACLQAARTWPRDGEPSDPAAWLYRVAERRALDALRWRSTRGNLSFDPAVHEAPDLRPNAEDVMSDDGSLIPDERLRLIFVCCHPAVAPESRAALTLRLVCGLTTLEIARAFLIGEATLAQRLVRAKRKIAQAGIRFEVPAPEHWAGRLDAVLSTLEIAYAKAHEDASGTGRHAGFAPEMLGLTRSLMEMLPKEPEVASLAALIHYAEARRPARIDDQGVMIPLSEQDPVSWRRSLIEMADGYLARAKALGPSGPPYLQAAIHGTWCRRKTLADSPPWREIIALYDLLLIQRDDPIVRLNRPVALAEAAGAAAALAELASLDGKALEAFLPYHAVRADLLLRCGRNDEAHAAYAAVVALNPAPAERHWIERKLLRSVSGRDLSQS